MKKLHKVTHGRSHDSTMFVVDNPKVEAAVPSSHKHGPVRKLEVQMRKKRKMDNCVMQQCSGILKKLMTHPSGWVFNQPVDPVALNIPDYFSIISKPMDLGTIKSKLEKELYSGTQEFAADVRLTFSNAMLYNPPTNNVHVMAKNLNNIFNSRWKSLEVNWSSESSKVGQQPFSNERSNKTQNTMQDCHKVPASRVKVLLRRSMSFADKQKLRKNLVEILKGKIPPPLLDFLQKLGLSSQNKERVEVDINSFDDETVWELQRIIRSYLDARSAEPSETANSCGNNSLQKEFQKGDGNRHVCGSVKVKLRMNPGACISGSVGSHNELIQASSSDVDSERSSRDIHACRDGAFDLGCLANDRANTRMSKPDPDSDGAVSALDEENVQQSLRPATPATIAVSGEGYEDPLYDGQLSPNKALRAAILKNRFADTILKAQQKTLLNHGEKGDPVKMQQERERLERKQREEKARIEAQIRASEAASRMKVEAELKMQREREREAARIALQKIEKTVEIDENQQILKDLEILGGYYQPNHLLDNEVMRCGSTDGFEVVLGALEGGHQGKALERLGLFMKDDYMEEEEEEADLNGDVEEGEIGS